jgi:dolichol-phosphate mannosyltransferase
VPITFVDRVAGHSKMSGSIVVEAMLRVTGWGIQRLFRRPRPAAPAP